MPHLFVNRHRAYDLLSRSEKVGTHFVWESVNAILYILGGVTFVAGSVLFYPALAAEMNWGVWAFLGGSVLYLVVTLHDAIEVVRYPRIMNRAGRERRLEILAAIGYLAGTVLFLVGSVFFFSWVGLTDAGAWCFIVGSVLFVVAAFVNVVQYHHGTPASQKLLNLTAVTFVAGSVLFATASVPYLWPVDGDRIATDLFDYLASQYLIGSVLFLAGGILNYRRAWIVVMEAVRHHKERERAKATGKTRSGNAERGSVAG